MRREELGDLIAFLAVLEESSFTRAAARLGTSQSALSHTVRRLEERLGVRLLTRTTRAVTATDAGEKLAKSLRPALGEIEISLNEIRTLRDKPAGNIRLTSTSHATDKILLPKLMPLMREYPDINIEISNENRLVDIVAERFDGGIRLGEQVDKDMIAVRVGPDISMAVVGAPAYFARNPQPKTPHDLTEHNCINLRLPTLGGLYAWEFERDGRPLNVRVNGKFGSNTPETIIGAMKAGMGLCCMPLDYVEEDIGSGEVIRVLEDWCPPFPGYHLYYPSRRQQSPAFALVVDALRYRRK